MVFWIPKKRKTAEVSESSVRIIRNNLENIGITIPLGQKDATKIFEWAIWQKEHCTETECSLKGIGYTFDELNLLVSEFNPYGDRSIDFDKLNRRLTGRN